ncbi:MAG: recombinase zinc beta ribbon domain-containing protein [Solirubrobacteraceae bacterium]
MPASYRAVHALLTNPAYAGAFVFGRTAQKRELDEQGRVRRRAVQLPIEEWSVCLPEHHPGYVSWHEYLATRERLRQNMRPRGEGGGAAREGQALLQGIVRCGRCGRRMQVAYSGRNGRSPTYACVRAFHHHGADHPCQSLGGQRLDDAVAAAFLEAVTPAGVRACTEAVGELERQHQERLQGQRLAVERAEFEAGRAERQFDACEPENRLVARTLERAWEQTLSRLESERRKLAELEAQQPEPLTLAERHALARLAHDLPSLWRADTTTARDRKELLRTLIGEVIVTVKQDPPAGRGRNRLGGRRPHRASGAADPARRRAPPHQREHRRADQPAGRSHRRPADRSDPQQAGAADWDRAAVQPDAREVRAPATRDPSGAAARPRQRTGDDRTGATQLSVSNATIYRWLKAGLLPGEQTTPHAPWRIRLTAEVRSRFMPDVPDDYLSLDQAAKRLGCARQTVLHKVQRGELDAVQVLSGRRKGLRIKVTGPDAGLFEQ